MSTTSICKNYFKSDNNQVSRQLYTQIWITLINQIERSKAVLAGIRS